MPDDNICTPQPGLACQTPMATTLVTTRARAAAVQPRSGLGGAAPAEGAPCSGAQKPRREGREQLTGGDVIRRAAGIAEIVAQREQVAGGRLQFRECRVRAGLGSAGPGASPPAGGSGVKGPCPPHVWLGGLPCVVGLVGCQLPPPRVVLCQLWGSSLGRPGICLWEVVSS